MKDQTELLLLRIEEEIEERQEFSMLSAPSAPEAPKNPFPDPVCPVLYW